jgi:hypothetical protein
MSLIFLCYNGLFETGLEPPDKMVTVPLIINLFYDFL